MSTPRYGALEENHMAMRVMQVTLPEEKDVERFLEFDVAKDRRVLGIWNDCREEKGQIIHLTVPTESTE